MEGQSVLLSQVGFRFGEKIGGARARGCPDVTRKVADPEFTRTGETGLILRYFT